jgi:membrane protein YqaA with SNARE-associated domain
MGDAMSDITVLAGMFASAFASATLLPGHSEALLVALLLAGHAPFALLIAATLGNVLGSLTNWFIGRGLARLGERAVAPARQAALERAGAWYRRYGKWSLLLSWVPVIGDPLTVVAGVLREPLPVFLLIVGFAKLARYLVVLAVTLRFAGVD